MGILHSEKTAFPVLFLVTSVYAYSGMRKYILLLSLILTACFVSPVFGQRFTKSKRYYSIGGSLNAMNYFGDITPAESFTSADIRFTRWNLGAHYMRRYGPRFSGRVAFNYGRVQGDDFASQDPGDKNARFRYLRNASFRNDIYELSVTGMWDLIENRNTFLRRPDFVPYLFAGVAGFYHNPRARAPQDFPENPSIQGKMVSLQPLQTEGRSYSRLQVAIPAGVGFRYKISPRFDVSFEIGYRYLFTDYLDDVSSNYPDPAALKSNLARAMSNRTLEPTSARGEARDYKRVLIDLGYDEGAYVDGAGNTYFAAQGYEAGEKRGSPNEKDWYLVTGFHLNYILYKGVRCPKFR